MRISRKDKKKLRAIMLCLTGNPAVRKKERPDKARWCRLKVQFKVWLRELSFSDRRVANTVK